MMVMNQRAGDGRARRAPGVACRVSRVALEEEPARPRARAARPRRAPAPRARAPARPRPRARARAREGAPGRARPLFIYKVPSHKYAHKDCAKIFLNFFFLWWYP